MLFVRLEGTVWVCFGSIGKGGVTCNDKHKIILGRRHLFTRSPSWKADEFVNARGSASENLSFEQATSLLLVTLHSLLCVPYLKGSCFRVSFSRVNSSIDWPRETGPCDSRRDPLFLDKVFSASKVVFGILPSGRIERAALIYLVSTLMRFFIAQQWNVAKLASPNSRFFSGIHMREKQFFLEFIKHARNG